MTITTTNESTVSFDNTRWSIGLAREVEWVRYNREDNLAVVRDLNSEYEFGREVSDIVPAFRVGQVITGRVNGEGPQVVGMITERSSTGVAVFLVAGAEWFSWDQFILWASENVSPSMNEFVRSLWEYHRDRLSRSQDHYRGIIREAQEWKQRLIVAAHEEANKRDYCSDFDDFMEENGLPRRQYEFEVQVNVQTIANETITIRVTAESADDAREDVDNNRVADEYRAAGHYDEIHDWDVTDVTQD